MAGLTNPVPLEPEDRTLVLAVAWNDLLASVTDVPDWKPLEKALCFTGMGLAQDGIMTESWWKEWKRKLDPKAPEQELRHLSSELGTKFRELEVRLKGSTPQKGDESELAITRLVHTDRVKNLARNMPNGSGHFFGTYLRKKAKVETLLTSAATKALCGRTPQENSAKLNFTRKADRAYLVYCPAPEITHKHQEVPKSGDAFSHNHGSEENCVLLAVRDVLATLTQTTMREGNDGIEDACKAFCGIFYPQCQIAYYRDPWLNRTEYLYKEGLSFPEAAHGFLWRKHDLPTWILFDESKQLVYPPFKTNSGLLSEEGNDFFGNLSEKGRFQWRENVNPLKVLCLRLEWGRSKVVLFLNRRNPENPSEKPPHSPTKASEWLSRVWAEIQDLGIGKDAIKQCWNPYGQQ